MTEDFSPNGASIASYAERTFRLWEYTVGHQSMCYRSKKDPAVGRTIDIIFVAVEFISAPAALDGLELEHGSPEDIERATTLRGWLDLDDRVYAVVSGGRRHLVVAGGAGVKVSDREYFESPFDLAPAYGSSPWHERPRLWTSYQCDHAHIWEVVGADDEGKTALCPHGHPAVTAMMLTPADRVAVAIVPAVRSKWDRFHDGHVSHDDEYFLELTRASGYERLVSLQTLSFEDATRKAAMFRTATWAEATERWKRMGLDR